MDLIHLHPHESTIFELSEATSFCLGVNKLNTNVLLDNEKKTIEEVYDQFVCLKIDTWFTSTQKKKIVLECSDHQVKNCNYSISANLVIRHRLALTICNKNRRNFSTTFVVVNEINDKKYLLKL